MSPAERIEVACVEFDAVGSDQVAAVIRHHVDMGSGQPGFISASRCGRIIRVLDGMNTSTAREVIQAVADNLMGMMA